MMSDDDADSAAPRHATRCLKAELSLAQEHIWLLGQLDPDAVRGVLSAWRLSGPLRIDVLRRCLSTVTGRNDALRATVHRADGIPHQVFAPPSAVELPVMDLSAVEPNRQWQVVDEAISGLSRLPFDLTKGPLYRHQLHKLATDEYVLLRHVHQIVTDDWSECLVNAELAEAYGALMRGREPDFARPGSEYAPYAQSQREQRCWSQMESELRFWASKLADLPTLEFPADRSRPTRPHHGWEVVARRYRRELAMRAAELAHRQGVSLYAVLAAACVTVLARYTGQHDIATGLPLTGRAAPGSQNVVGRFANMAVLRTDLSGDPSFATLLARIQAASLELSEHRPVPFHLLVDQLRPARVAGRNPLFQVRLRLSGATGSSGLCLPSLACEALPVPADTARLDLAIDFVQDRDGLRAVAEYSADLFDQWRISALLGHIEVVLTAAAADPTVPVWGLPVLPRAERSELLAAGNGGTAGYPADPLHVILERIVRSTPDAVAVICREAELSYRDLDHRADQLARYLRSLGLRHEQVVAVVLDRDLDAYVAMAGILKAGCAFAMLDPGVPRARLDYMIKDTAALVVVTRSTLADRLPEPSGWTTVLMDADWPTIEVIPAVPLDEWTTPDSLAYVIYTSGSTGTPKGVMVTHRAVASFCEGYRRSFGFGPQDRLLQLPALNFDMSQGEIWTALRLGATLVAVAPEEAASPTAVSALMREQQVTYAGLSLAMQAAMDAEPYPALRYIMGGAEALVPGLVNKWNLPGRTYLNLYGPTEGTIAQTEYPCEHATWETSPPIGRPLVNRQVYIVDQEDNLVPKGVNGELLIGGAEGTLALGYLNQPDLTAAKFSADPFSPGSRVYRTGDLVRWSRSAQIEFLGRVDNQVNLNGHRVELGEIEQVVQSHPGVTRAIVLMRRDRTGADRLVCYFTSVGEPPAISELRGHVGAWLQDYVVPTAWVPMARFPMNATGAKIDRNALPEPADDSDPGPQEPWTITQAQVARCFREVLSLSQVGIGDSFFSLGGNSLQAMRLVSKINDLFKIRFGVWQLFANPTIIAISAVIDEHDSLG